MRRDAPRAPGEQMITSAANPRVRLVRRLLGSRRQREREGLFVTEGEDLLDAARAAGIEPLDVLVAGEDVEARLLEAVSTMGYAARTLAVFRRGDLPLGRRQVAVALWRVSDPGNVGTLVRAADAFGACVALSEGCADPTGPRALRASAGAIFRVPVMPFDDVAAPRIALVPRDGPAISELELADQLTFVLGAEREGLPDDLAASCDFRATIPQAESAESLNVAMAGTIALYELARRRSSPSLTR